MRELPTIPIIPNGKRYWVLPDERTDTVREVGGFKLNDTADQKKPPLQGRIVAVGDATDDNYPDHLDLPRVPACKYVRSQVVFFGEYSGNVHRWDGVEFTILREEEILGALPLEND